MNRFSPQLDILPEPQRLLWPEISTVPANYVLYGGTAIALRLGHRISIDFDFFSSDPLNEGVLYDSFKPLADAKVIQKEKNALSLIIDRRGPVNISFFGNIDVGRVGQPELTEDGIAVVASMIDLFGHKLKVILQRIESKDYLDVAALLDSRLSLADGLAAASALFCNKFAPMESVRSLTYFVGGDLDVLPQSSKETLIAAASSFSPESLRQMKLLSSNLIDL